MCPFESSKDSNPPVGSESPKGASGEANSGAATSVTRTTCVPNSLMINVAVLRGVGVSVRVGVRVIVGVLDAVGLEVGVDVLAVAGLGIKSVTEQASKKRKVQLRIKSFRMSPRVEGCLNYTARGLPGISPILVIDKAESIWLDLISPYKALTIPVS